VCSARVGTSEERLHMYYLCICVVCVEKKWIDELLKNANTSHFL
jgi:hypothetical protein